mmetsp:Transcript_1658/g.5232  ORF Transcript_1658/g.5232 Transcript_1658/m.5232 type:complete len:208 (-) Transcript_1658:515-1138(-)
MNEIPEFLHVHLARHRGVFRLLLQVVPVAYRLACRQVAVGLHVHPHVLRLEQIGVDDVGHRAGVVQRRVVESKVALVRVLEEREQVAERVPEFARAVLADLRYHRLRGQRGVGNLQRYHGDFGSGLEDDLCGLRVDLHVELGDGSRVPQPDRAPHEDDLQGVLLDELGVEREEQSDVRQGSRRDELHPLPREGRPRYVLVHHVHALS